MKPYYRPATFKDGLVVAKNLRDEDRREVEGLGRQLIEIPFGILTSDTAVAFFNKDNEIAGVAGISPDSRPGVGIVWMLCTPALTKNPVTFVKQAKAWLREQHHYTLLWNLADARNHFHHKLLKMLGFRALRSVPTGPDLLPYLEIVYVPRSIRRCSSGSPPSGRRSGN